MPCVTNFPPHSFSQRDWNSPAIRCRSLGDKAARTGAGVGRHAGTSMNNSSVSLPLDGQSRLPAEGPLSILTGIVTGSYRSVHTPGARLGSGEFAVAMFVLFAAAAGAGFVAPDA